MTDLSKSFKEQLSKLLGHGHSRFGRVAPRRPFKDDEGGGAGEAGLNFETHPLLAQQPIGAASDLTQLVDQNNQSLDAVEERANEASEELQKQPAMQKALGASHTKSAAPTLHR